MSLALSLLICSIPWITEVVLDLKDSFKGKVDQHKKDIWVLRLPAFILASLLNTALLPNEFIFPIQFGQSLLLCFGLFVMFFDMTFGTVFKKDPFYLGTTSELDKKLIALPKTSLLMVRLIILTISITIYISLFTAIYG